MNFRASDNFKTLFNLQFSFSQTYVNTPNHNGRHEEVLFFLFVFQTYKKPSAEITITASIVQKHVLKGNTIQALV